MVELPVRKQLLQMQLRRGGGGEQQATMAGDLSVDDDVVLVTKACV